VLAQRVLELEETGVLLEVAVHLATATSVMVYYRKDLVEMLRDCVQGGPGRGLALRIVVSSVPAVVAYVLMKKLFDTALESAVVAAVCLCVTGLVLLATRWARPREDGSEPGFGHALLVGCAQAVAILPGISRSGSTIATALFLGDQPARAARFSFLMSVPVIVGAGGLQSLKLVTGEEPMPADWVPYAVAAVAAFVSGIAAIHVLVLLVSKGRLALFGPYCLLVGAGFLIWLSGIFG
jgi:undecaprenyl-diphosphatase